MSQKINIFWFRRDLRINDNAGLYHALESGLPVLPIFIFDTDILHELEDREDKRVSFIYQAIQSIQNELVSAGRSLEVHFGKPLEIIRDLLSNHDIDSIYCNHDYEPYARKRDEAVKLLLEKNGIQFHTYKDQVIFEKSEVMKDDGGFYSVFTPYSRKWKALLKENDLEPFPSEKLKDRFLQMEASPVISLEKMGFIPSGEFSSFQVEDEIIKQYHDTRNIPSVMGTTRVGVHLRFGTVSIRALASRAKDLNQIFLNELIWREFFMQILWHEPRTESECFKTAYENIRWRNNEEEFSSWTEGRTGYPIVDAGMRELNATGFMHNRVRMIVGSFLVKHLLIDWRWGEAYFAKKLMDYELSSNIGNWQWVAGCGCDAAPYFRIFSPEAQTKKFDDKLQYIRKWVPEFEGFNYSKPIVDHAFARERCLKVYKEALVPK
jgi:deoxyribodipyrimidine photo-lyase